MTQSQTFLQLIVLLTWLFLIGQMLTQRKAPADPRIKARFKVTRLALLILGVFSALAAAARLERLPAALVDGLLLAAMVSCVVALILILRSQKGR
jgi:hypothetical protein